MFADSKYFDLEKEKFCEKIKNSILVGHGIKNDVIALNILLDIS